MAKKSSEDLYLADVDKEIINDTSIYDTDIDDLHTQWALQSKICIALVAVGAEARIALKEAQQRLEVRKAELDLEIRESPEMFSIEKVTVDAVKAAIIRDEGIQKLERKIIILEGNIAMYSGAMNSLEHKKKALEKLTDLHINGYYASKPNSGKGRKEVTSKAAKYKTKRNRDD